MDDFSGGKITIRRRIDGAIRISCNPSVVVISPENAIRLARALMKEAGIEVVMASPGETVIRPPMNGKLLS